MKVMVFVKATEDSEAGRMPGEELMTAMMRYNEELVKAGVMLAGDGLKPSSQGARVQFNGKDRTVVDGPFAETKELVAGYWIWQVKSLDEAIEWVKRCPNPMFGPSEIAIRPLYGLEELEEITTDETRGREARISQQPEGQQDTPKRRSVGRGKEGEERV